MENSCLPKTRPKGPKMAQFLASFVTTALFLRIDSLVFFGILYDAGDLKTDAAKFLGKILTCAKSGQKDPKCSYLSVHCGCIFFSGLAH